MLFPATRGTSVRLGWRYFLTACGLFFLAETTFALVIPASVDFGSVRVGSSLTKSIAIQNTGTTTVQIQNIKTSPFTSSLSNLTIQPGATANLDVIFTPDTATSFTGTLTAATTDPTNPTIRVALTGRGTSLGFNDPVILATDSGASSSAVVGANPHLAAWGDNVYVAWAGTLAPYGGGAIAVNISKDGGATFKPSPVWIRPNPQFGASEPGIAVGGNNVYVDWVSSPSDISGPFSNLAFAASSDGGNTFSTPIFLGPKVVNSYGRFPPKVAAYGSNVQVLWDNAFWGANAGAPDQVYFASSQDGGQNFGNVVDLSHNPNASYAEEENLAVSGNNVFAVWKQLSNLPGSLTGIVVEAGLASGQGVSFADPVSVTSNIINPEGPQIAAQGSAFYLVWEADNSGGGNPSFKLPASPASLTVNTGGTATSTITGGGSDGFDPSITVSLSACSLPPGVSVSFSASSIPVYGSSTLTFTASSNAAPGTYPITVIGTGGGLTETTSIALTVTSSAIPSFTLSASPWISMGPGSSVGTGVTATASGGFSSAISLSVSGLPSGVSASFGPSNPPAPGSSTLTFTASNVAVLGTYFITVTGTGGGLTECTNLALTIGTRGIFFVKGSVGPNNAISVGMPILLSDRGSAGSPKLALLGNYAYVVWHDNSSGALLLRASQDAGINWGKAVTVSDTNGSSQSAQIAATGDTAYVAWTDSSGLIRLTAATLDPIDPTKDPSIGASSVLNPLGTSGFAPLIAQSGARIYVTWQENFNGGRRIWFRSSQSIIAGLPPDPSTVAPPIDNSVVTTIDNSTAFLYSGPNPIQTGVAPNTILPTRAAVLRGKVLDKTNSPLPGVTITILNHKEFGETLSRADGMFDLAVNGGGSLTVTYTKMGFLGAQRQVQVPCQDFAFATDVVLIPQDLRVTPVDLTSTIPIQVVRGSVVIDSDGTRQPTLFFPQGTQATMKMPDGSTQPITTLNVRCTEFTTESNGPQTMPAELPPTSGYTCAVEFNADEAQAAGALRVEFADPQQKPKPIPAYVENFLNFPVGTDVPLGSYDKNQGTWIASDNGRVVKILSITGGAADLDTGSGTADNGTALPLPVTPAERQQLASLYNVGQTLWRTPVAHLSSWDSNWGFAPPPDATPYSGPGPQPPDPKPDDPCNKTGGSIIESQSQVLGEAARLTGTPFTLNYRSDRVRGRKAPYTLTIPLSGPSVPASLEYIVLQIRVAGQFYSLAYPPTTNQTTTFTWDGKDAYGREVQGAWLAVVRVGYTYKGVYQQTSRFGYHGNGIAISGFIGSRDLTLWGPQQSFSLGAFDFRAVGLGAWSLNVHHVYDVYAKVLYLGSGGRRSTNALGAPINTVAGGGSGGDGGPATSASLSYPRGVAVGPDGSLYIADTNNSSVRQVDPKGIITKLASIGDPESVAVGPDGRVYIADYGNCCIRRVESDGTITIVAGNGSNSSSGDGGPAKAASIGNPQGVAVGYDGSFYISSYPYNTIRRVGTDGIITTMAGNGATRHSGDGGPATAASLASPLGIAVGYDGSLYIVEPVGYIRKVGPDGIITTVAGNGGADHTGDGGAATDASFRYPSNVAVGRDGSLYIADTNNNCIRRVGPDGIITTVAGSGVAGFTGDGGSAPAASMNVPRGVAVGPDGSFYISDYTNSRIRRVRSALPGFSASDLYIASEDGAELYHFNSEGRHLSTLSTLTGAILYQFAYDAGRLFTVTDGDGNITTINHDANGNPSAIVAPFLQRTTLTSDPNGYLASITDPAGGAYKMVYTPDGLLSQFTDPNGNTSSIKYDPLGSGRLYLDTDPAGGFTKLSRIDADRLYTVSLTTALNRTTTYQVENQTTGSERRVNTFPDGTQTELLIGADGSKKLSSVDGTTVNLLESPDPRFSMQAPLLASLTMTVGGLTATRTTQRTVNLADQNDLLSLTNLTDTITRNGRTFTSVYDAATKTFTQTSATGRKSMAVVDAQGRVIQAQVSGLLAFNLTYDSHGRLATITQGTGSDERTASFSYNSDGYLQTVRDPLDRNFSFQYDAAGRLSKTTLPDGSEISHSHDANGNLKSLTPPGRPPHIFSYTPVDLTSQYAPPLVTATGSTSYEYNPDQQLALVKRPDNKTASFGYDCCLNKLTIARGVYTYASDPMTGHLAKITAPDGGTLSYTYNGALLSSTAWSGTITGSVSQTYDNDLRVTSLSVNGAPIDFGYDGDGLLTRVGALTLIHDPQKDGLLTGSSLGNENEILNYNGFGELTDTSATCNGATLFAEQYTRDRLGRITQKAETIDGVPTTFDYTYDLNGRLFELKQNGITTTTYAYDSNGNRTSINSGGVTTIGTYDDQDRLTQYGNTNYTYTANGELQSKTDGTQTTNYNYDELGNLLSVTLPGGTLIEYVIDGQNRRIAKMVGGNLVKGFLYQDSLKPIAELDGNSQLVSRFIYGSRSNVPDYMVKNGTTYRIVTDQLGSPRLVVDVATGTIAQRMDYEAFGRVIQDTNPGFQPFGFAGGLYDGDTELVRFGTRDYDAQTGRWTTKDPIVFNGAENLYAYASNNPITLIDPRGLIVERCGRVADIPIGRQLGLEHQWIRTSTKEGGLGPANGGVPGGPNAQSDSPYTTDTSINDHTGQGDMPGATCHEVPNVDEECVNRELSIGQGMGKWTPINQCQTVTTDILHKCGGPPGFLDWFWSAMEGISLSKD
jgi:RHS repeat-associated protein